MELSPEIIKRITLLVAEKLGDNADLESVAGVVREAVARISVTPASADLPDEPSDSLIGEESRKMILNSFGISKTNLADGIRGFIAGKALRITDITTTNIDSFTSIIAVIDYTDYKADLSQFKFELEKICTQAGFKVIIQDSEYYKTR